MGLFDFLKKFMKEEEKIVVEKIYTKDIPLWIERKTDENSSKEKNVVLIIGENISRFDTEIKSKIKNLEAFDVDSKKEIDKIKSLVNESRSKYIDSLHYLLEKLKNIDEANLEQFMTKINKVFKDFNRDSLKIYEKVTILIGKEMVAIRDSLKLFSKKTVRLYDENKGIVELYSSLNSFKFKLNSISSHDVDLERIEKIVKELTEDIEGKGNGLKSLLEDIENVKRSEDYLERLNSLEKIDELKKGIKSDLSVLKQMLDFKALANFFHINQDQLRLVKNHKENFYDHYDFDKGQGIISLLEESKLINDDITKIHNKIRGLIEDVIKYEGEINEDETLILYPKVKELEKVIYELKEGKEKENRRSEKLKTSKEEIIIMLKQELSKMNVEVV